MRAPGSSVAHRLGLLVLVSAMAGLVASGLALPMVGGLGLATQRSLSAFEALPSVLDTPPLPQVSKILAADGSVLATFYYEDRVPVPLADVPEVMRNAIIAIEDSRFYEHHGVDIKGLLRAALRDTSGGSAGVQGGSTLTQQYVKNVLIESATSPAQQAAARADTLARKIQEARYALALEHRLSKDQILEGYLNISYFGDGAYGIGSAAQHYFGEPVQRLSLTQSALLAGIVQNPYEYAPDLHPEHAKARRDVVLARMAQLNLISTAEARSAISTPITLHVARTANGCEVSSAPYFCDYVLSDILASPAFGATPDDRARLLRRGGLTITTTLDPAVQRDADRAVRSVAPWDKVHGAAEAVVQPGTGHVLALAVNAPYGTNARKGQNAVDWATDADHGGSGGFQSGSTFKVFVLTAALKQGIPLGTVIDSPPQLPTTVGPFAGCSYTIPQYGISVQNAEKNEGGRFNLVSGTVESVNTFYVQLEERTGMCDPATIAEAMGLRRADGHPLQQVPSMVLGANEVSPLDMANAYATLAAHGKHCAPVAITKVVDRTGTPLPLAGPSCQQVLDPGLADTVTSILAQVIDGPDPFRTGIGASIGRPAAGKTGTVTSFTGAWFAGYTPQLSAAVWLGFPGGFAGKSLQDVAIGGQFYPEVFGGTAPASIWRQTMLAALANTPVEPFAPADPTYTRGLQIPVPDVTGLAPASAVAELTSAGFTATVAPNTVASPAAKGTVASTSPPAGSTASPGTDITVFVSNGHPPVKPKPTPTPTKKPHPHGSASPTPKPTGPPIPGSAGPPPATPAGRP